MWVHLTVLTRHLGQHHDHREPQLGEASDEGCLRVLEASIRPTHHVPRGMDLLINRRCPPCFDDIAKAFEDLVTGRPGFEPLGIENSQEAVVATVVVDATRHRLPHPGVGDISTKDSVDKSGLARPRGSEDRQVEATQGSESGGQLLREHALESGSVDVLDAFFLGRRIRSHALRVRGMTTSLGYR